MLNEETIKQPNKNVVSVKVLLTCYKDYRVL